MEILIGMTFVLFMCLIAAMRWVVTLLEDLHNLQIENRELVEELIALKQYNSRHKKQQLND
jgi:hypothetical protein